VRPVPGRTGSQPAVPTGQYGLGAADAEAHGDQGGGVMASFSVVLSAGDGLDHAGSGVLDSVSRQRSPNASRGPIGRGAASRDVFRAEAAPATAAACQDCNEHTVHDERRAEPRGRNPAARVDGLGLAPSAP